MSRYVINAFVCGACLALAACVVESVCYNDADCPKGRVCDVPVGKISGACFVRCKADTDCPEGRLCDLARGLCVDAECHDDDDCDSRFECIGGSCVSRQPLLCPSDMVPVENQFCIDIYEASRADATVDDPGVDNSRATSRAGLLPWQVENNAQAQAACEGADKTLCGERQWFLACRGPAETNYSYGDDYSATICNGIDKYCSCDAPVCADHDPCPYPHCFRTCGATFHLDPTGSAAGCTNGYGIYDINGNLWEHVQGGNDTRVRGGAFNCSNSEQLHRCDYIPSTWTPSARGFRCCSLGLPGLSDGGPLPDGASGGDPTGGD